MLASPTHIKKTTRRPRRKARRVLFVVTLCLALVLLALGVALLLAASAPADYRPHLLSHEQQQAAEFRAEKKGEEFYNQTHRLQPFTIAFEQDMLNDLLLLDDAQEFLARHLSELTDRLRQPQIAFLPGQVRLLARVPLDDAHPVLAITLGLSLAPDGQVAISLDSVHAGRLPLPDVLLDEQLQRLAKVLPAASSISPENRDLLDLAADRLGELLTTGRTTLPARFRAVEDKSATITGLRVLPGRLELDLDPAALSD